MVKQIIFVIAFVIVSGIAVAQEFIPDNNLTPPEDKSFDSFSERLFFGGGFGMQFGTYTNVEIAPLVGVKITPEWFAGGGFSYQFISARNIYTNEVHSTSFFGPRFFTNYLLISDIFAHLEYEALSLETKYYDVMNMYPNKSRFWMDSFLIGAGYRMPVSERSSLNLMILYNLNETSNSIYTNPVIRVGFYF
ncbi:MAG: hypothetical protein CVU05_13450 [Bacteroidetes bacterium HGW-Bacteroidetes-21]|jgi:hypothetical protein|nr:MAG: hypothetical protein CVU05_13450 [Bacteroidetes bacterium HGW-Bacteroidetes-21]